ncbi:hypothetical protein ACFVIN_35785, partial [Streptomyces prasinus]
VMALYMMVFLGGAPVGAPIVGWITDTYGARVGLATGGAVAALAATVIGLVLARVGNLRLSVGWDGGHPRMRFVPRTTDGAGSNGMAGAPAPVPAGAVGRGGTHRS